MRSRQKRPAHHLCTAALLLGSWSVAGCDKLTSGGPARSVDLLKSGSEKVCAAADVQKTVRGLIAPNTDPVADDTDSQNKAAAVAALTFSFAETTLQAFDKAVSKASCNAVITIAGNDAKSNSFDVTFDVSPSADSPGDVVVFVQAPDAKAYAQQLVNAALDDAARRQASQRADADAQKARAQLLATLTPKWLSGRWIPSDSDSVACADGSALDFLPNHAMDGRSLRWALKDDELHIVGSSSNGPVDQTLTHHQRRRGIVRLHRVGRRHVPALHRGRDEHPRVNEQHRGYGDHE